MMMPHQMLAPDACCQRTASLDALLIGKIISQVLGRPDTAINAELQDWRVTGAHARAHREGFRCSKAGGC